MYIDTHAKDDESLIREAKTELEKLTIIQKDVAELLTLKNEEIKRLREKCVGTRRSEEDDQGKEKDGELRRPRDKRKESGTSFEDDQSKDKDTEIKRLEKLLSDAVARATRSQYELRRLRDKCKEPGVTDEAIEGRISREQYEEELRDKEAEIKRLEKLLIDGETRATRAQFELKRSRDKSRDIATLDEDTRSALEQCEEKLKEKEKEIDDYRELCKKQARAKEAEILALKTTLQENGKGFIAQLLDPSNMFVQEMHNI
ncbi:tax1-binding protein 1 homolog B-like [Leucoraja erinacea]|uniref:tax1-binding protein 1 homolog B-like n=1 Tax=Leucoraja erinaceus TaxID=7782 RepID=UPI002455DCBC|nr:tax1-binding protein 1 homolog B-like [Leucoraja erinacea]